MSKGKVLVSRIEVLSLLSVTIDVSSEDDDEVGFEVSQGSYLWSALVYGEHVNQATNSVK